MREQDTVEWYLKTLAKAEAAKEEARKPNPPTFSCCGWMESEGHNPLCVHFQPEGETKTNRIVQHFPAYMDFDPECVGFDTLEELLEIPWVKRWSENANFYQYSGGDYLMAEFHEGYEWWAIGKLRNPVEGLPEWKEKHTT